MAREDNEKKVFMASAAPGVRFPNVYGIDMPSASELIAHGRTDEEVGNLIGADWLIYQELSDLIASAAEGNRAITSFECSVFNGEYVTGDVDQTYLNLVDSKRNDAAKLGTQSDKVSKDSQVIGIHNDVGIVASDGAP